MAKRLLIAFALALALLFALSSSFLAAQGNVFYRQLTPEESRQLALAQRIPIDFFYSDACHPCQKIKNDFLPGFILQYANQVEIKYHNTADPDERALRIKLQKEYGMEKGGIPLIFLPTVAILGARNIRENLVPAVEQLKTQMAQMPEQATAEVIAEKNPVLWHFSTFSPAVVALAGLVDGVNPCAFATMIFFVSFLAINSYRKDQILYIGATFILAVFLTYLALGLGFFQALKKMQMFSLFSQILYYTIACLAIGLGISALADYIKYKRTGLTQGCNLKLYNRLRALADSRRGTMVLVLAAFVNGFIIALLELGCTGQVYVPTIALVLRMPELRLHALIYLILYNVLFIIPLIIIFILAYQGFSSQNFARFTNRHFGVVKLSTALLFFALGLFLILR